MGNSPLMLEPKVTFGKHFCNAIFCKELGRGAFEGGSARHGLDTVLTELEKLSFIIWIRPSTAWTIEPVFLVNLG